METALAAGPRYAMPAVFPPDSTDVSGFETCVATFTPADFAVLGVVVDHPMKTDAIGRPLGG